MTRFENGILEYLAKNYPDTALKEQCNLAKVTSRKNTGVGCYSEIEIVGSASATKEVYGSSGSLDGPLFNASNLKHGGGVLIWFESGFIKTIDIYTYDDIFPINHDELGKVNFYEKDL